MGRKNKITDSRKAKKYQRDRTKQLKKVTDGWDGLQKTPPRYLSKTGARLYRQLWLLLQDTQVVKQADHSVVEALVVQMELARMAYADIQENGIQSAIYQTPVSPTGEMGEKEFVGFRKNPAVNTLSDSTQKIKQLSAELGLTPESRASLLNMTKPDDEGDPMAQIAAMLNGKGDK
ncbi:phage terminase small subunit P27 family [uncultured Limosilactobacillus sp.]|uniref:phage terminase small subunit P27 family n=1 Tax=uncultured Limosilactobacillus sp. TaxID=2837629 RepID=UPI0025E51D9A|nr:phage terminase small subunit P27 family [uncultured Limosilactobacillus sp.]